MWYWQVDGIDHYNECLRKHQNGEESCFCDYAVVKQRSGDQKIQVEGDATKTCHYGQDKGTVDEWKHFARDKASFLARENVPCDRPATPGDSKKHVQ